MRTRSAALILIFSFILLFFASSPLFALEPKKYQVEVQANLCRIKNEAKLIRKLNLSPKLKGWIVYFDTAQQDYRNAGMSLRFRAGSEAQPDGSYKTKTPEATLKISNFGAVPLDRQVEIIRNLSDDHERKTEFDLHINQPIAEDFKTFEDMLPTLSLSVDFKLDKKNSLNEGTISKWALECKKLKSKDGVHALLPLQSPYTDCQEETAALISETVSRKALIPVAALQLTKWSIGDLDLEKKTMILPKNGSPVYELSTKIEVSSNENPSQKAADYKSLWEKSGVTLCGDSIRTLDITQGKK